MQLAIKQAHLILEETKQFYLDDISKYETLCLEKYKMLKENNYFKTIFIALNEFNLEYNDFVKSFAKDNIKLLSLFKQSLYLLKILDFESDKLSSELFNNFFLKFKQQTLSPHLLGSIKKIDLDLHFLQRIENLYELILDYYPIVNYGFWPENIFKFKSNYILLFYLNDFYNICSFWVDKNGGKKFIKENFLKISTVQYFDLSAFVTDDSNLFIYTVETHRFEEKLPYLRSLNQQFELLAFSQLDFIPEIVCGDGNNFLILTKERYFYKIKIFNLKLEIILNIQPSIVIENIIEYKQFLFPINIKLFSVNRDFFIYALNQSDPKDQRKTIFVMRRDNGKILSETIDNYGFDQLQVYLDKYILTFNKTHCILKTYNLYGDVFLSNETFLDKEKLKNSSFYVLHKELAFLTPDEEIFII
jgi:hypothetical protein